MDRKLKTHQFTSSIEIELEMSGIKGTDSEYSEDYVIKIIDKIRNSIKKELSRTQGFILNTEDEQYIENYLLEINDCYDDDDRYIYKLFKSDVKLFKKSTTIESKNRLLIVNLIKNLYTTYFFSDNFQYIEERFIKKFPTFYEKWGNHFKFEIDDSLVRGIELSNKKYFTDLNQLTECISDFYKDYNGHKNTTLKKKYFQFKETTGIHINLGLNNTNTKYNILKGLLFLDDLKKDNDHIPYVFKGMETRLESKFTGSIKKFLLKDRTILEDSFNLLKNNNIQKVEDLINPKIKQILLDNCYKYFGFNIIPLEKYNYIEFRYAGHQISEEVLIDKVYYFANIIQKMTSNIERKGYLKRLYKVLYNNKVLQLK